MTPDERSEAKQIIADYEAHSFPRDRISIEFAEDARNGWPQALDEIDRLEHERDIYRKAYEKPFERFEVWPIESGPRYRLAGFRADGTMELLEPIFLRDEIVAGLARRAEAAESERDIARSNSPLAAADLANLLDRLRYIAEQRGHYASCTPEHCECGLSTTLHDAHAAIVALGGQHAT